MDGFKFASVAGMVTMGTSVFVEYSLPTLVQVGQGQPQPAQVQPEFPARAQPGATDPLNPAAAPQPEGTTTVALFALRDAGMEQRLTELRAELERIERQMRESNARMMRQLAQVRLLDGDRKVDAVADVVQAMLEERVEMEGYLTRIRESLTGRGIPGSALGIGEPKDDEKEHGDEGLDLDDDDDDEGVDPIPPGLGGDSPLNPR
jgi:hypothetical protein